MKLTREPIPVDTSLKEAFANFKYKIPEDKELMMYDFYFLTVIAKNYTVTDENVDFIIQETVKEIVPVYYGHMVKALKWSLNCEIRHIFDSMFKASKPLARQYFRKHAKFVTAYYQNLRKLGTSLPSSLEDLVYDDEFLQRIENQPFLKGNSSERLKSNRAVLETQKLHNISNLELADIYIDLYEDELWGGSYGGEKWQGIAVGWSRILKAKNKGISEKIIWIDHAYDLQHNTSTVFNKIMSYVKNGGYSWVIAALDWKRDVTDPRQFYYKVSPQLKSLVAYIGKNHFGLTMADFKGAEKPSPYGSSSSGSGLFTSPPSNANSGVPKILNTWVKKSTGIPAAASAGGEFSVDPKFFEELLTAASMVSHLYSDKSFPKVFFTAYLANSLSKLPSIKEMVSFLMPILNIIVATAIVPKSVLVIGSPGGSDLSIKYGFIKTTKEDTITYLSSGKTPVKILPAVEFGSTMGGASDQTTSSSSKTSSPSGGSIYGLPGFNTVSTDPSKGAGVMANKIDWDTKSIISDWTSDNNLFSWAKGNVYVSQALLKLFKQKYSKVKWALSLDLINVYIHYERNNDEIIIDGIGPDTSAVGGWWKKGTLRKSTFLSGTWKQGTFEDSVFKGGVWKNGTFTTSSTWESGKWEKGYVDGDLYTSLPPKIKNKDKAFPLSPKTSTTSPQGTPEGVDDDAITGPALVKLTADVEKWVPENKIVQWANDGTYVSQTIVKLAKKKFSKIKWVFNLTVKKGFIDFNEYMDQVTVKGYGGKSDPCIVAGWWKKGTLINGSFSGTWKQGEFLSSMFNNGEWINGDFITSHWIGGVWHKGAVNGTKGQFPVGASFPESTSKPFSMEAIKESYKKSAPTPIKKTIYRKGWV